MHKNAILFINISVKNNFFVKFSFDLENTLRRITMQMEKRFDIGCHKGLKLSKKLLIIYNLFKDLLILNVCNVSLQNLGTFLIRLILFIWATKNVIFPT